LTAGIDRGQTPHIAGPLAVVLFCDGVQAGSRFSDVTGGKCQIAEPPDVIGPVYVLGYPHTIENGDPAGVSEEPCRFYDFVYLEIISFNSSNPWVLLSMNSPS